MISRLTILRREKTYPRSVRSRSSGPTPMPDSPFSQMSQLPTSSSPSFHRSGSSTHNRSFGSMDATAERSLRRTPSTESFPAHWASSSSPALNMYSISPPQALNTREAQNPQDNPGMLNDIRGRKSRSSSFSRRLSETLRAPLRRTPSHKSIGSIGSGSALFPSISDSSSIFAPPVPYPLADSGQEQGALYSVVAVHPCIPPSGAAYMSLPFFELQIGDEFDVLEEAGHPSNCEGLPLAVDHEADCLLVVRSLRGEIGWALASFLVPA